MKSSRYPIDRRLRLPAQTHFLGLIILLTIGNGLGISLGLAASPPPDRPNVILIMADDMGWGDTSYYGHPILKTPALDQMATDGMRLDRFYAGAPVCSPTRGSVLTGRHPFRYGVFGANRGHLPKQEINLAQVLKRNGFRTGHFGKWHLGTLTNDINDSNRGGRNPEHFAPPWQLGFDTCFSTEAKTPTWWNPGDYDQYGTRYWTGPGEMVQGNSVVGDDSRLIMDAAIPFIERATETDEPFFCVIWFHTPHKPIVAGPDYLHRFRGLIPIGQIAKESAPHYYGCLTALDEQVGRLRSRLRELKQDQNTLICFCSDNGPENKTAGRTSADLDGPYGQPPIQLSARKRSLREGGIRVPGLIVWPERIQPGSVTHFPAVTSDYLPTVLEATGLIDQLDHRPLDGISLLPVFNNPTVLRQQPIGFQTRTQKAWITHRYKLLHTRQDGWQLYDLTLDPSENNDLSETHPAERKQLQKQLEAWVASCQRSLDGHDYE